MSIIEAIILGVVQGLTEFLPVSSSGHIELGTVLLGVQSKDNLLFSVVVHSATALSTIVVFRKDIARLIIGLFKFQWNDELKYISKLLLSMVPVGLIGVFYKDQIEAFFGGDVLLVGFMLLLTATLLAMTYYARKQGGNVTYPKAFIIGMAQAIAILPGISRSGATIATSLLIGVEKEKAARFSFLMVLLPIIGASLLEVKDFIEEPALASGISGTALLLGFIAAFVSGLLACQWMISIVKKGKLIYFAIYCLIVGIIAIITALT
ncbi:undecaprenyl-diphosphatase [Catalinimonas alkaloidigena]|uniref:undecaprenyl-diphosphate phosphatase n=1 Tax=Catalinimonas alkaloidigena TaxID=1075417 RepID=UPI002406A8A5|nr:undecaprenyl-diphosphate phosphatase [Catalinimonas alkaloidigena]MDF9798444.1 undecaprenyl-diphosphatase [Catalinimonas alkaloidigena]